MIGGRWKTTAITMSGQIGDRIDSAPCRTRTCDPRIRNPLLYPAELRAQREYRIISVPSVSATQYLKLRS